MTETASGRGRDLGPVLETRLFLKLLASYVLFGAFHELTHVLAAIAWHGMAVVPLRDGSFWCHVLLARQTNLLSPQHDTHGMVRHAGWIASALLAVFLYVFRRQSCSSTRFACTLTALEAICTDLMGLSAIPFVSMTAGSLLCGNFGIIVLHQAWLAHNGKSALDVLEKLVEVTMMRGAQSGGVVSFDKHGRFQRTRVVNKKRTSLSRELRKHLEANVSFRNLPSSTAFSGHTRFATSSKAELAGTHPQQWSKRTSHKIFDGEAGRFVDKWVENFM